MDNNISYTSGSENTENKFEEVSNFIDTNSDLFTQAKDEQGQTYHFLDPEKFNITEFTSRINSSDNGLSKDDFIVQIGRLRSNLTSGNLVLRAYSPGSEKRFIAKIITKTSKSEGREESDLMNYRFSENQVEPIYSKDISQSKHLQIFKEYKTIPEDFTLTPDLLLQLVKDIGGLIDDYDSAKIILRDISPGNIVVDQESIDGSIFKLIDIELATADPEKDEPSGAGTFPFMNLNSKYPEDVSRDFYSLGMLILYWLVPGGKNLKRDFIENIFNFDPEDLNSMAQVEDFFRFNSVLNENAHIEKPTDQTEFYTKDNRIKPEILRVIFRMLKGDIKNSDEVYQSLQEAMNK